MNFTANTEVFQQQPFARSPVTDALVKILCALKPGETITYQQMIDETHTDVRGRYRHLLDTAKAIAERDYDVVVKCVRNIGYERIKNNEIASVVNNKYQKRLESDNSRYQQSLDCVDPTGLDHDGKTEYMLGRTLCSIRKSIADKPAQKELREKISRNPIEPGDKEKILKAFWGKVI